MGQYNFECNVSLLNRDVIISFGTSNNVLGTGEKTLPPFPFQLQKESSTIIETNTQYFSIKEKLPVFSFLTGYVLTGLPQQKQFDVRYFIEGIPVQTSFSTYYILQELPKQVEFSQNFEVQLVKELECELNYFTTMGDKEISFNTFYILQELPKELETTVKYDVSYEVETNFEINSLFSKNKEWSFNHPFILNQVLEIDFEINNLVIKYYDMNFDINNRFVFLNDLVLNVMFLNKKKTIILLPAIANAIKKRLVQFTIKNRVINTNVLSYSMTFTPPWMWRKIELNCDFVLFYCRQVKNFK